MKSLCKIHDKIRYGLLLKNRAPTGYGRQKVFEIVYLLKFYDII